MKIRYRFKRFLRNLKKVKDTEQDKKLKNNQLENREIIVTKESGNYYDYNTFLVYVNNYQKIVNLYGNNTMRQIVERKASEIKILIESTIDKHFLDSLNFFHQINNQNIDPESTIQTNFVKTSFLFSPPEDEEKVYVLISGSIGDFINLFDHYYFRYSNERNKIIKSLIDILDTQIPVTCNQYEELCEKYNLKMRGINYTDRQLSNGDLLDDRSLKLINEPTLLDINVISNSILKTELDKKIVRILDRFFEEESSKKEIGLVCFFPENEGKYQNQTGIYKINLFKLSYLIDNFDEKFDNTDHFLTYNKYALVKIQKQALSLLGTSIQTITYCNDDPDKNNEQISMYDLVDEIIKE